MTCKDCHQPLTQQEEYRVMRSVTKEERCYHCGKIHIEKELVRVLEKLEARNYKQ